MKSYYIAFYYEAVSVLNKQRFVGISRRVVEVEKITPQTISDLEILCKRDVSNKFHLTMDDTSVIILSIIEMSV